MVGTVEGKPERTLARGYLDEWPGRGAVAGDGVGINLFRAFLGYDQRCAIRCKTDLSGTWRGNTERSGQLGIATSDPSV